MPEAVATVKSVALEATIIRADGSREELGRIAHYDRNPIRRLISRVRGEGRVAVNKDAK